MAKMFYTAEEAAEKLGTTPDSLQDFVREGKLREFRDGDSINYKVGDVEALVPEMGSGIAAAETPATEAPVGGSEAGEVTLEPADDSSVEMAFGGSDMITLEPVAGDDTAVGTDPQKKSGDTAVPSVGVNVFDDEVLDEHVDPLAQTAVSDIAGLGVDSGGSGSGILDLSREGDDTSFGQDLISEIYADSDAASDTGEDTRAGLDEAPTDAVGELDDGMAEEHPRADQPAAVVMDSALVDVDPLSASLTGLLVVAVLVMWIAGLAGAALVRGITPSLIRTIHENLTVVAGGIVGLAVIVAGVTYVIARRS